MNVLETMAYELIPEDGSTVTTQKISKEMSVTFTVAAHTLSSLCEKGYIERFGMLHSEGFDWRRTE